MYFCPGAAFHGLDPSISVSGINNATDIHILENNVILALWQQCSEGLIDNT